MNKELSHKQIISILLPFTLLLIAYFWSYGKSTDVTHPLILKKTPWQTLTLPLSSGQIYEFTEYGTLIRTINASDFGIENYIGDIQFLSKNDFIIYGGFSGTSTTENLEAFARSTPNKTFDNQQGLWLCTIDLFTCKPFTHELPSIKQAFHLSYDSDNEHVYLTNTSHHMFYRFNLQGEILDKSSTDELHFPNQIRIFDNQIWLADTNNKQINYYDLNDGSIGTSKGFIPLSLPNQCTSSQSSNPLALFRKEAGCWPSSLAKVDKDIWVGVKNNNMEEGDIHIYSKSGALKSKLDLTNLDTHYEPDPIGFVQINNRVVFSDLNNLSLYAYDLTSNSWASFNTPEKIQTILDASLETKVFYRNISHIIIGTFAFMILVGLYIGLKQEKAYSKEQSASVNLDDAILPQPKGMPFWFGSSTVGQYFLWIVSGSLAGAVLCFYLSFQLLEINNSQFESTFILLILGLISVALPGVLIAYQLKNKRLGIAGRLMLISSKNAETVIRPINEVYKVGERGVLIDHSLFIFGRGRGAFINKHEYQHYLEPRLAIMKTLSEWEYLKFRMKNFNKESKLQVLSFVPATIIFGYLALTGQI